IGKVDPLARGQRDSVPLLPCPQAARIEVEREAPVRLPEKTATERCAEVHARCVVAGRNARRAAQVVTAVIVGDVADAPGALHIEVPGTVARELEAPQQTST